MISGIRGRGFRMRCGLRRVAILVTAVALTTAGGSVSAAASVPVDEVARVTALQSTLRSVADAGDVAGTRAALSEVGPVVGTVDSGARELVVSADDAAEEALAELDATFADDAARVDLPPVPILLNLLLQKVLAILAELIANLLGGLPAPIPPPIP